MQFVITDVSMNYPHCYFGSFLQKNKREKEIILSKCVKFFFKRSSSALRTSPGKTFKKSIPIMQLNKNIGLFYSFLGITDKKWKEFYDSAKPHKEKVPAGWDERLKGLERYCVVIISDNLLKWVCGQMILNVMEYISS